MTKSLSTLGILLFIVTMIVFFVVYFFFSGVHFYTISLSANAFVLPIIYVGTAFWSVKSYWNKNRTVSFKTAFKRAFMPMFIGGFLSVLCIYSFLNIVDTDAKNLLNYQFVKTNKDKLDETYKQEMSRLKEGNEKEQFQKDYQKSLQSFNEDQVKGKDMLTASHFSGYFAAILIFYVVLSVFFGAFFRTRSVYQEEQNQE